MKPLHSVKTRLAGCLSPEERGALSLHLLDRVTRAALCSPLVGQVWVVGGDDIVANRTQKLGALWLNDEGRPLNKALFWAFGLAFQRGIEAALYIPADLALVSTKEVTRLINTSGRLSSLVFAPAFRDRGTNAILMPRHLPFKPMLAEGESLLRHLRQAAALGYPFTIYGSLALGYDLDTESDLRFILDHDPDFGRVLVASGVDPRDRIMMSSPRSSGGPVE